MQFYVAEISIFLNLNDFIMINICIFSKENPLNIEIVEEDGAFTFSNNHTPKRQVISSVGIGLKNLSERFKILSGVGIEVEQGKETFNVKFNAIKR